MNNHIFSPTVPSSYEQYLENANSKGREFSLTDEQYKELIQGGCFYCLYSASDVGIDRVENNLGTSLKMSSALARVVTK